MNTGISEDEDEDLQTYALCLFLHSKLLLESRMESTTIIDSWEKFQKVFGQDLTHKAQDAIHQLTQLFQVIKENLDLMERIEENLKAMRDEFDLPTHRIERLVETTATTKQYILHTCLSITHQI